MTRRIIYLVTGGLVIGGAIAAVLGWQTPVLAQISLQTIFLGMVGGLFQLLRDASQQEHLRSAQIREHAFGVATSHMAEVAFDRYATFCDEYIAAVHDIAGELFREGAGRKTLTGAARLVAIQQRHAAWIDKKTRDNLNAFEQQLRSLGATAEYVKTADGAKDPGVGPAIKKQYDLYKQILNIEPRQGPVNDDEVPLAIDEAIEKVRQLLQTEGLAKLRRGLIDDATSAQCAKS